MAKGVREAPTSDIYNLLLNVLGHGGKPKTLYHNGCIISRADFNGAARILLRRTHPVLYVIHIISSEGALKQIVY